MHFNSKNGSNQFDVGDAVVLCSRGISNGTRGEVIRIGENGQHCWVLFSTSDKPDCFRNSQGGARHRSNGARGGVGKPTIMLAR